MSSTNMTFWDAQSVTNSALAPAVRGNLKAGGSHPALEPVVVSRESNVSTEDLVGSSAQLATSDDSTDDRAIRLEGSALLMLQLREDATRNAVSEAAVTAVTASEASRVHAVLQPAT
eukprot:7040311-Prymnesium_polylepis.5